MEVKFIQNTLHCLCPVFSQVHTGEQTQEIRLPDAYPDIGKILGCWGQVLIRGKEWRNGTLGAACGVMAYVLYAPEDGTQPRVVDAWIPMQCRWDVPQCEDDGVMHLIPMLTNLDARGISARKMILRASADTFVQGLSRQAVTVTAPPQLPEDIQLLKRSYPVELPLEAGEKQVQYDERISLPGNLPPMHKLVRCSLTPTVTEQKVLGNRLVFRGQTGVDLMYMTEEGDLHQWQTEFPFSQFTELDRDYSPQATAWVSPIVTAMETDVVDGQLHLHGGLAAQYTIFDQTMLEMVEDAFSPSRNVNLTIEQLQLPIILDRREMDLPIEGKVTSDAAKILCASALAEYPSVMAGETGTEMHMDGQFQLLSQDTDGQLMGETAHFVAALPFFTDEDNKILLCPGHPAQPEISLAGEGFTIKGNYPVAVQVYTGKAMPMVTQLELGELREPDGDRPSLILRRAGKEGLWNLAKKCGSTVAAIQQANQLSGEPEEDRILLIPVS